MCALTKTLKKCDFQFDGVDLGISRAKSYL